MSQNQPQNQNQLIVKPAPAYAFFRVLPSLVLLAISLLAAAHFRIVYFLVLSPVFLLRATYRYFYIRTQVFYITGSQIKSKKGIFSRRTDFPELYRVRDYIVNQSLVMRLIHAMDLSLITTDLSSPQFSMTGIPLSDLPDTIRDLVQQCRRQNNVYTLDDK